MAHFPNHQPERWEFTRVESVEHRTRRLATTRQHQHIDQHRSTGSGLWWEDQRYIDQVVPSHFTDPKSFDNFNYRYQLYARHPIQCPPLSLSDATDEPPPIRYDIKRIAHGKPIPTPLNFPNSRPSCCGIILPPLPKQRQLQQQRQSPRITGDLYKGDLHCEKSHNSRDCGSRSMTSASQESMIWGGEESLCSSRCDDCGYGRDNNEYNNNNNNNIDNNDTVISFDNLMDVEIDNVVMVKDDVDLYNQCALWVDVDAINGKEIVKSFHNIGNECGKMDANFNNNSTSSDDAKNMMSVQGTAPRQNTNQPIQIPLEVLKSFPITDGYDTCGNKGKESIFLCRPKKSWPEFPPQRILSGKRLKDNVGEEEKRVQCRRIFRCDSANTPENARLDAIDPLVVCKLQPKQADHRPGYGTYKIIASRQYKEPPQRNIIDNVPIPEHLRKFREYQRRCPNLNRGLCDRTDGNKSAILLTSGHNPFRYNSNPHRPNRKLSDCAKRAAKNPEPDTCWPLPRSTMF